MTYEAESATHYLFKWLFVRILEMLWCPEVCFVVGQNDHEAHLSNNVKDSGQAEHIPSFCSGGHCLFVL